MLLTTKKQLLSTITIISISLLTACGGSSNKNTAPTITGNTIPVINENTTEVGQYIATDDGNEIVYSLSGADQQLFTIDQQGNIAFINAPDFDNGETGPYTVTVIATDEENLSDELPIIVTVGDIKDTPSKALVQTVSSSFTSSQVAVLDIQTQVVDDAYYAKSQSGYTLSSYQDNVYHIGQFFIDTIDKYNADDLSTQIWSYSTQDNQDAESRNPYTLVSVSETKAYLLRYGSDKVWIVNPQVAASSPTEFKIGELDLSAYVSENNSSNTPNPAAAVINDGKLFIAMQRWDDGFSNINTAYVAVFDIETDTEIETNANANDNVKGIPLAGLNPLAHSVVSYDDKVYVTTKNSFLSTDLTKSVIEEISVESFSLRKVVAANELANNSNKFIKSTVIVSAEQGYFQASANSNSFPYSVDNIYQFNPTTGEIITENVLGYNGVGINNIALDAADYLWVSVALPSDIEGSDNNYSGVDVFNTETNTRVNSRLETELPPAAIIFIEE